MMGISGITNGWNVGSSFTKQGDSQTTPPLWLTGHLVMSSGHSWGSSEEGSSHTLHEPRMWSDPALHPRYPCLPVRLNDMWGSYTLSPPHTPHGAIDKGSKGGAGGTDLGSCGRQSQTASCGPQDLGHWGGRATSPTLPAWTVGGHRVRPWSEPTP